MTIRASDRAASERFYDTVLASPDTRFGADLMPGVWTKVKIEVRGDRARLYVHGHEQPTLIVNDLKTGAQGRGGVALWIDRRTVAHFRNVTVKP